MNKYEYVNVQMGTFNTRRFSSGNVLPIASVPHGMASFTIQNEKSAGVGSILPIPRALRDFGSRINPLRGWGITVI